VTGFKLLPFTALVSSTVTAIENAAHAFVKTRWSRSLQASFGRSECSSTPVHSFLSTRAQTQLPRSSSICTTKPRPTALGSHQSLPLDSPSSQSIIYAPPTGSHAFERPG